MRAFIEWLSKHSEVTLEFACLDEFGYDQIVRIRMEYIDAVARKRYCAEHAIDIDFVHYLDCNTDHIIALLDNLYEKLKEQINEEI